MTTGRRFLVPAFWAALAESGVVYLLLKLLLEQATQARGGILYWFPSFVVLFVAGAVASTWFRESPSMTTIAAAAGIALGLIQGTLWGVGAAGEIGTAVAGSLLVTLRVATLGLRDWRNPIHASFGWGAGILLAEVVLGGTIGTTWRGVLAFVVGMFFAGSLASRAASVRVTGPPEARTDELAEGDPERVARRLSTAGIVALAIPVLLIAFLTAGGGLRLLGEAVYPVLVFVVSVLAFLMSQVARPILWLFDLIHVDLSAIQRFLARLNTGDSRVLPKQPTAASGGVAQRIIGLLFLAAVLGLLVWLLRRRRAEDDWGADAPDHEPLFARSLEPRVKLRTRLARHRELPEDTVRRWYAEALLLLERKGLERPPGATPGEFLRPVGAAFPECRHGFHELTRAYEAVRYGGERFSGEDLRRLEPRKDFVMEMLRRAHNLEPAEEEAKA
ncbi:MAG TPA: DUF4129 domain-containing protein [Actinomycetota bacterium]|nr:DUF4129 domain-containing protein [Actinomycetota bacterium]